MLDIKQWSMQWGGRTLTVETGRYAFLTNGSCTVRYGDTVLLATVVMSKNTREGIDFFPLMVNFEEKMYAAGKIKGSRFIKREGKASEEAILSGRLVDRAIRPLFNQNMRNDVQVVLTALSFDGQNDSQIPAMIAAATVLAISDVPWTGPIAGARIGKIDGKFILNPSLEERSKGDLDLVVAGTPEKIIMVEAEAKEIPEEEMIAAMQFGAGNLKPVIEFINKIVSEVGKQKIDLNSNLSDSEKKLREVEEQVRAFVKSHSEDWIFDAPKKGRAERVAMVDKFSEAIKEMLEMQGVEEEIQTVVLARVKIYVEEVISERILEKGQRLDGRKIDEIRPLFSDVNLLPRTHGTGMFMRGDTQVLSVVTLGAPGDKQTLDTMEEGGTKRYMHHYNDTPASYGEAGPLRGPGNRAIGHGALAEKALVPVLPEEKDFPYTIRVVSEVMGSNGSSSMASTCGSTLALMDAGVPIKKPVAGIAMGLASVGDAWKVITDLQDIEDGPGGMDFKITGTRDGITAIQMDTKTVGLNWELIKQTFKQSFEAREKILSFMEKTISQPRQDLSPFAPRIVTININPDKIRDVIGPGGKMINKIIDETGAQIDIEQDGRVIITSSDAVGMKKAVDWVNALTHEITAGEVYDGEVVRLEDFGAFINVLPGQDGLVHVSEIAWSRTNKPSDVLKIGDKVKVLVKEIDNLGRVNLSMRALLPKPEGYVEYERPPRSDNGGRGGFGGRGGNRGGHRGR
ncbi:MAG TPA: polyribonucleotide nucleotidyltransferase [Candidatus Magasanikbacteria bacterium]|nr:polyribonucleotide nucleotidyltransferase [Candidatus Magasanikbacteria bacterium]